MDKKEIYIAQFGTDSNVNLLPLAAGYLVSRLKKEHQFLEEFNCQIKEILFRREAPEEIVARMKNPVIMGFSCYLWNTNHSLEVAKTVKENFPGVLIVFGGHSVPESFEEGKKFLEEYPFVDVLTTGEGEEIFTSLCINHLNNVNFHDINGIIFQDKNKEIFYTGCAEVLSLDKFPSPYLDGTFDDLYDKYKKEFSGAIMEITRGCPYKCSYCAWGNQSMSLRTRPKEILQKEIEWIGKKGIDYISLSDSNFGIGEADVEFVRMIAECKKKYGTLKYVSVSWVKNSSDKILEISQILKENNIGFRVTLSLQSLNKNSLRAINRINMEREHFEKAKKEYSKDKAYSYTELILGLPLETYESFISGIDNSLSNSIFDQVWFYPLFSLPNTELAKKSYKEKYGIESRKVELAYAKNKTNYEIKEFVDMVIGTFSMPKEKWKDAFIISNYILAIHDNRLAFFILYYLKEKFGIQIRELIEFMREESLKPGYTTIRNSFLRLENHASEIQEKGKSHLIVPEGYDVPFDSPEAIFLELLWNKREFYRESFEILKSFFNFKDIIYDESVLQDLFKFQEAIIATPQGISHETLELEYDWVNYFKFVFQLETKKELIPIKNILKIVDPHPCYRDAKRFLSTHFNIRGKPAFNFLYDEKERKVFPSIEMPGALKQEQIQEPKAILFDFDGVLADTMKDNFLAWKKAFENFGIEIQEQDYFPLEGMKLIEIVKKISSKYGLNSSPEEIVKLKNQYYLENYSFSFYPMVLDILDSLKSKGKLLAIVSASPKEKLEKTVPADFLDKFNAIVSGDDTENGKPNPEPYLVAMRKLNISPKDTIVIENAPLGIKSAKAAGVRCIAITTTLGREYLKEADEIVESHEELKELLGSSIL